MESMTGFAQRKYQRQLIILTTEYSVSQKLVGLIELKETGAKQFKGIIDNERILTIIFINLIMQKKFITQIIGLKQPIIEEIGITA